MTGNAPYPLYIERAEEQGIQQVLGRVRADGRSRAILLYGVGGVGKTSLVRQMSGMNEDPDVRWLDPIDVDNPDGWLLSNLETLVATAVGADNDFFRDYTSQVSQLPSYTRAEVGHDTIIRHLNRIKDLFARSYREFIRATGRTVVITFDTVETIRGTSQLLTLTRWMKALPTGTLFILAGRPGREPDSIEEELTTPYRGLEVTRVPVGGFTPESAREYLDASAVAAGLQGDEKEKLVRLSRGHPLWLAFAVAYLGENGAPREVADYTLGEIEAAIAYEGELSPDGRQLHAEFQRSLVAPYRRMDFWHEAIKRLAVVRQPVAREVWRRLMLDCPPPPDAADLEEAWTTLLAMPWVRARGDGRFVTLHDAVAEAFAQRLFPLHDPDQHWRNAVWARALVIYTELGDALEAGIGVQHAALDDDIRDFQAGRPDDGPAQPVTGADLIEESVELERRRRELDHLRAAQVYYQFLNDFPSGCRLLLDRFATAEEVADVFLQDLLALYMQRFLPGGTESDAFNDVIKVKLVEFRTWLAEEAPDTFIELGVMLARYLTDAGQPTAAIVVLGTLPPAVLEPARWQELHLTRANAHLRIGGHLDDSRNEFLAALSVAEAATTDDRDQLIGVAHKELGFFYRSTGQWVEADNAYAHARDTLLRTLTGASSPEERDDMASIQTMWAYVKGLDGRHGEGLELAAAAISVRSRIDKNPKAGMSWSTRGEVFRYARRFHKAWDAYGHALELLQGRRYWGWQGIIRQQQAICLYQAANDGLNLTTEPMSDAHDLIREAMDVCQKYNIRSYPSALNRAGRIFGHDDPERGLDYLKAGINEARELGDGWFWYANLVEFAELSYRAWVQAGLSGRSEDHERHRAAIIGLESDIHRVRSEYRAFPDLAGRWSLLLGHLAVHDYLAIPEPELLDTALEHYRTGFANLARRHVASSGAASIGGEFRTFSELFLRLPAAVQADWQAKLRVEWSIAEDSAMLLAHLEELY